MDASDGVILLTGLPLAGLLIADGALARHVAEVASGLVVALLVGGPGLARTLAARLLPDDDRDPGADEDPRPHG